MGRNIQSDGVAEDLIRSFVQLGCAETHMKTLIEKYNAELENGMVSDDEILHVADKISEATDEMNALAELRRGIMLYLFNQYKGDKDYWCLVKHLGIGSMTLFEAYQASDDDPELYTLYLESNKHFVKAITHFLGVEISDCAACLSDLLKAKKGENHAD